MCARCGTPLAPAVAASEAALTPTQVPSYGRLSIPSPTGAPAGIGMSSASTPTPPAPPFQEQWQPVTMPAPVEQPKTTRLGLIAVALAVVIVGALLVTHLRSDPLPPGTSAFVAGGGETYTAPDGSFQVLLPQTPVKDQRTITVNSVSATIYMAVASTKNYEIAAASILLPGVISGSRTNDVLDSALSQGISNTNGTLVHKDLVMHGVLPAIEGTFKAPDGYQVHLLVVASGSTLVMLEVHAKSGTERLYKALESSLVMR